MVNDTTVSIATGCAKVTVPVDMEPPVTVPGLNENEVGEFGVTVTDAVLVMPFAVAETWATVLAEMFAVSTVNAAKLDPAGTVTVAGIELTAVAPEVTFNMTTIFAAAVAARVTVPVLLAPAITALGENENAVGVLRFTVNDAVFVTPEVAEI